MFEKKVGKHLKSELFYRLRKLLVIK